LSEEVKKLRSRRGITNGVGKTKSRKGLSKALIVSVDDVIRLRQAHNQKETEKQGKIEQAKAKKIRLQDNKTAQVRILKPTKSQLVGREKTIVGDGEESWEEESETMSQEGSEADDYTPAPKIVKANTQIYPGF